MEINFTVPLVPPSVNHYVKHTRTGRHYVTQEAKAFKAAIAYIANGRRIVAKRYEVEMFVWFGAKQRGDLDNLAKCALDGLCDSGVITSDAAIYKLVIGKSRDASNPRTEITVRGL